ncbi:MAG: cytochrome b N-terminal domain-containing protein [Elusimicrobiota bacterium]
MMEARRHFLLHFLPETIGRDSLSFVRTQWTGIAALVGFLILCLTGVLLMFFYVPSTAGAYDSIINMDSVVPLGAFTRSLHRFSSHVFVLAVFIHLLKAFYNSSCLHERQNWFIGLGLFAASMLLAYTGYLLPYDQTSYWAVTVGLELARSVPVLGPVFVDLIFGGGAIDAATITRFYGWHAALGPAIVLLLLVAHFWKIRKKGLSSSGRGEARLGLEAYARKIGAVSGAVLLVCVLGALFFAPDAGPRPWLAEPPNPVKAPWYFLGVQELVSHSTALLAVPVLLLTILLLAPFLLGKKPWRTPVFFAAGLLISVVVGAAVVGGMRGEDWRLDAPSGVERRRGKDLSGAMPAGIIETRAFGRVDRCLSCHEGMRHKDAFIDAAHPADTHGCASCHGGVALSLDPGLAHPRGAGWGEQRLLSGFLSYAACFKCHIPGHHRGSEMGARGIELVMELGCPACHKIGAVGRNKSLSSALYRDLDYLRDVLVDPTERFQGHSMPRYAIFEDDERFREIAVALIGSSLEKTRKRPVDWALNCSLCHPHGMDRAKKFHDCPTIRKHSKTLTCMRCHGKGFQSAGRPCPYIRDRDVSCRVCHD